MTLDEIRKYIDYVVTKSNTGYTMTPDEYNSVLQFTNQELYNTELEKYEESLVISENLRVYEYVMGGDNMPLVINSNGIANIPSDYERYSSMWYKRVVGSTGLNPEIEERVVEILTDGEMAERYGSVLITSNKYPYCTIRDNTIEFRPKNIGYVEFTYLKKAVKPVYDYYISSAGEEIALAAGEVHVWQNGEYDSSGNAKNLGDPNYTSQTVEILFPVNTHVYFIRLILSKVGINLRDEDIYAYAEAHKKMAGNEMRKR